MIEQPDLFKAILHVPSTEHGLHQCATILKAMTYITDNELDAHYVNMYANDLEVVVVMNNRDAALKLKLAML